MAKAQKERNMTGGQRFLIVFIPILLIAAILLTVAAVKGINVFEESKRFVAELKGEEAGDDPPSGNEVKQLRGTVDQQRAEIEALNSDLRQKDSQMEDLQKEIERYQAELDQLKEERNENLADDGESAKMFAEMSPKNAAAIISELKTEQAYGILGEMNPKERAAVLEKMSPEKAAELASLLLAQP
ncbi:MotE family protein [Bacillus marinisedimentorum]|uniref:MotE family protein n=1 Tax=Bacillus marinisedimentorum TaxID=1821260 RepID=UPI0007E082DE|nr:hypothetical protein [Bacillus marinisedimentorum]